MKIELKNQRLHIKIANNSTIDRILQYFHVSRKQRTLLYQNGAIHVHKQKQRQNIELFTGDHVIIDTILSFDRIVPWHEQLQIQYEDDLFLIVNKPCHILVHSDGTNTEHTLCNQVQAYFDTTNQACPVRPIHRLDMETTGLVLFCKLPFFQPMLDHMLEEKQIYREYDAIISGSTKFKNKDITYPIARDRHDAKKMRVSSQGKSAKTIVTTTMNKTQISVVHCQLQTGRTHQIRVHLAALGHPIVSDPLYGSIQKIMPRLALHASILSFYHPILQKQIQVTCPLPKDMQIVIKK